MQGLWTAFFLAVSAFCNAGFDILGHEGAYSSLIHYTGDPIVINIIVQLLSAGSSNALALGGVGSSGLGSTGLGSFDSASLGSAA